MSENELLWTNHCAPYSKELMPVFARMLQGSRNVLDPMAGTGRIHDLADMIGIETVGIEIEPEGVNMHPRTILGDATDLPYVANTFEAICVSPSFANRMNDHYRAQERCKKCASTGKYLAAGATAETPCDKCEGTGFRKYKRYNYRASLPADRALHENNNGRYRWGKKYQDLIVKSWQESVRVLIPQSDDRPHAGKFILNVKNHWRTVEVDGKRVPQLQLVAEWHQEVLEGLGLVFEGLVEVETPGMRHGQNGQLREPVEKVMLFRKTE